MLHAIPGRVFDSIPDHQSRVACVSGVQGSLYIVTVIMYVISIRRHLSNPILKTFDFFEQFVTYDYIDIFRRLIRFSENT